MAKIVTQTVEIKLSRLVKDDVEDVASLTTSDLITNLEVVTQELVGKEVIVEITEK